MLLTTQSTKTSSVNVRSSEQRERQPSTKSLQKQPRVSSKDKKPKQLNIKKCSQLNLAEPTDFSELLKMTDKIGISSTRHHNPDFISKMEKMGNAGADDAHRPRQDYFTRAEAPGGTHTTMHMLACELNSPKYTPSTNQVLQEIMSKHNRDDKIKKIKLEHGHARKDSANRSSVKGSSSTRGGQVSNRENSNRYGQYTLSQTMPASELTHTLHQVRAERY